MAPDILPVVMNATCVARNGRAVLILGASGSGKSDLGLALMAFGAGLVADDRTILSRRGAALVAACPAPLSGLIEARFAGILRATPHGPAPVALVVNLDQVETERLPPRRSVTVLGIALPLLHKAETSHFAAAVLQYLMAGRSA